MNQPLPPHYVTSLEEIFWGGTLVAITLVMHGFGMLLVLRSSGGLKEMRYKHWREHRQSKVASAAHNLMGGRAGTGEL
jgi:hypothetical protein